ncbi:hypothetical protein [Nonlabens sp. Asnod3-A02]|uniref:hypothetical protein n=1 Tax=Nonlabens sp. Asnod3-A02 TaxID=3160579 RepID=UPI0038690E50
MEALVGLIALFIKIAILGSVYATLVVLIIIILAKFFPDRIFENLLKNKKSLWFTSGFIISILLFGYSFTFWGDHGLGDSARIPLSHFQEIDNTNWIETNIEPVNYPYGAMSIESFSIMEDVVVGTTAVSPVDRPLPYFLWNVKTNYITFFKSEEDYIHHASVNHLAMPETFQTFGENYSDYWNGWRFWMLP